MAGELVLPPDFEKQMQALLGGRYIGYKKSLEQPSLTSIRVNPQKPITVPGEPVPWSSSGYYLPERPVFTFDPLFHAGVYYVQEASSMFLEQAIRQTGLGEKPLRILDLCAAPGGKSTHLLSLLHPESLLIANEAIRGRTAALTENISKWGYPNVLITNNDPKNFRSLPGFFDAIVVDAPCSGEGLFRKDTTARKEWSLNQVQLCSRRQQRIIDDVWPALKQGGVLIYSTCTHNRTENEELINRFVSRHTAEPVALTLQKSWNIEVSKDSMPGYRFYPHQVKGEGFFIAVIRKSESQKEILIKPKDQFARLKKEHRSGITNWLTDTERINFFQHNQTIRIIPDLRLEEVQFLYQHLSVLEAGTAIATLKHDKLVPEHSAALSIHLNRTAFRPVDLSLREAINYLRKENITLDVTKPGFTLVEYKHIPIGWVNVLPNRVNNIYPSSWRIRMNPGRQ
jgi:16S rRNA C967 or C1407 C5-methylase (RsmB/RsmF family)/NOL1/NOP2/fmu family ribosome biogenesis protein